MDIIINDIDPRVQYTAAGGQTVFGFAWAQFAQTDIVVYQTPVGTTAFDTQNILTYTTNYTVQLNAYPTPGGTITLNVGANAGDIITLIRNMPEARLINYLDGGQFSATQLNTDLDRTVMMAQTNTMYERDVAPHYNTSSIINNNATPLSSGVDTYLPILPPNTMWVKNNANTAIVATAFAGGGGGAPVILPSVPGAIVIFDNAIGTITSSAFTLTGAADGPYSVLTDVLGNGALTAQPALALVASGKNMVINGDFQVWQRGAGGSAVIAVAGGSAATYTADRWQLSAPAGANSTVSQIAGATSGSYLAKVQRTAGQAGIGFMYFGTSLTRDMCIGAAGQQLTISFKAKAGANFSGLGSRLSVVVYSGTGNTDISGLSGSFVGAVDILLPVTSVVLNPLLTSYSLTSAPIGANVTQLAFQVGYNTVGVAGADDSFSITDVKLEISPVATAYDRKPFSQVLSECQPFYQKTFNYNIAPAQAVGRTTGESNWQLINSGVMPQQSPSLPFIVSLFFVPVIGDFTFYNPVNANAQIYDETQGIDLTGTIFIDAGNNQWGVRGTGTNATVSGDTVGLHWTVDVDLT